MKRITLFENFLAAIDANSVLLDSNSLFSYIRSLYCNNIHMACNYKTVIFLFTKLRFSDFIFSLHTQIDKGHVNGNNSPMVIEAVCLEGLLYPVLVA